jgi:glycosyltransferase involved in cell wall biosynthesis
VKPTVLHVLKFLSRGGPSRALIAAASADENSLSHRVVSLEPADPKSTAPALAAGLTVIDAPDPRLLHAELERADVVHVHFWNSPELYAVLTGPLPPMRLVLSCHVGGKHPPHVLTNELVAFADLIVATGPYTAELPVFRDAPPQKTRVIPAVAGWQRVAHVRPRPHRGYNVGYIGTVQPTKMHPCYVAMSARVRVPDARFVVCGSGNGFAALAREADALGIGQKLDLRGYVEDIGSVIEALDVFGYPLCEENYSSSELALQEAMYCGVPSVVMAYGGAQRLVIDGRTGLVAADEDEYVNALERLHADPEKRLRLGRAAAAHARATWNLERIAATWTDTYLELAGGPKRPRSWPRPQPSRRRPIAPGAALFLQSLGGTAPAFATSLGSGMIDELLSAEAKIARCSAVLSSADGGVLHWRTRYPDDPWLRLWSGLVLHGQRRSAFAIAEFNNALRLGLGDWRVQSYLARSARMLGNQQLVQLTLDAVPHRDAARAREIVAVD